jgi:heptosyltransferase-2
MIASGERVLLQLPAWLGDFVQAEPVVRALDGRPDLGLTLAGEGRFLELLDGRFPRARRLELRAHERIDPAAWRGHDAALLCSGSWRVAWTAWRAGIPRRIGWARDGRGFLLTEHMRPALERGRTPLGLGLHGRGRRYLPRSYAATCVELAQLAGIAVRDTRPRLEPTPAGTATARARLDELGFRADEPFWLASVGGRAGSAKAVPVERWAAILDELARGLGFAALLVAGPGEDARLREVFGALEGARVAAAHGRPVGLAELVALARRARLVVVADSGPRHVARAAGASVVTLYGPTDPRHGADHGERERGVRVDIECGPCHRERCPLAGAAELACWERLAPAEVLARARELLG